MNDKISDLKKEEYNDEELDSINAIELKNDISKIEVNSSLTNFSIMELINYAEDGDLILPPYQRGYVWDIDTANEFLESVLMNIPIPSIFLTKLVGGNEYTIVDGQQRIRTLLMFIKDQKFYNEDNIWKLKSNSKEWDGKSFNELSEHWKKSLERFKLDTTLINIKSNDDIANVFHIFARINKGGIKLSFQQIRQSIFFSKNMLTINEMANKKIKNYIEMSEKDKNNSLNTQLLLRVLNIYRIIDKKLIKTKTLTNDLNETAEWIMNKEDGEIKKTMEKLDEALDKYIELKKQYDFLGKKTTLKDNEFIFSTQTNPIVFETVIYVLMISSNYKFDEIKYKKLFDEEYEKKPTQKTKRFIFTIQQMIRTSLKEELNQWKKFLTLLNKIEWCLITKTSNDINDFCNTIKNTFNRVLDIESETREIDWFIKNKDSFDMLVVRLFGYFEYCLKEIISNFIEKNVIEEKIKNHLKEEIKNLTVAYEPSFGRFKKKNFYVIGTHFLEKLKFNNYEYFSNLYKIRNFIVHSKSENFNIDNVLTVFVSMVDFLLIFDETINGNINYEEYNFVLSYEDDLYKIRK